MKKQTITSLKTLLVCIAVALGVGLASGQWTPPSAAAPGANIGAPLTSRGGVTQVKSGGGVGMGAFVTTDLDVVNKFNSVGTSPTEISYVVGMKDWNVNGLFELDGANDIPGDVNVNALTIGAQTGAISAQNVFLKSMATKGGALCADGDGVLYLCQGQPFEILPANAVTNSTQQFTLSPAQSGVVWSVGSGSISSSGLFTAPSTCSNSSGICTTFVTAKNGAGLEAVRSVSYVHGSQVLTPGSTFVVPPGVKKLTVEIWGGGGAGGTGGTSALNQLCKCFGGGGGGGGSSGEYKTVTVNTVPGTVYTATIGTGGVGTKGNPSTFAGITALGGAMGGVGGLSVPYDPSKPNAPYGPGFYKGAGAPTAGVGSIKGSDGITGFDGTAGFGAGGAGGPGGGVGMGAGGKGGAGGDYLGLGSAPVAGSVGSPGADGGIVVSW